MQCNVIPSQKAFPLELCKSVWVQKVEWAHYYGLMALGREMSTPPKLQ